MSVAQREWLDDLRTQVRQQEAEILKLLEEKAKAERERDEARSQLKAAKAAAEARWSWAR